MRAAPALSLLALLALTACSDPDYYLLPPPAPAAQTGSAGASLAVAEITLPTYAEALEIATVGETGAVELDKNALWADEPRSALTRQLARALQARLRGPVGTEPWPGFDGPALRVEVQVDRLIGSPEGVLQFTGRYVIVAPTSGRIAASDGFAYRVPVEGVAYPGLLAAHARAVDTLADEIAARILRIGGVS